MAETLHTAIALPYAPGAGQDFNVNDVSGPRTITFDDAVYRPYLAAASRTPGTTLGTEEDPHEAGAYLQYKLREGTAASNWTVAMGTDGRWRITYSGAGSALVTWAGTPLAAFYGFTSDLVYFSGQTITATYQPTHFAASIAKVNDTGRTPLARLAASARLTSGRVYGWSDGQHGMGRRFDLRFHPRDAALATSLGSPATPAYPTTLRVEQAPSRAITGSYTLPWSLYETVRAGEFCRIAVAFGNFQNLLAGSEQSFAEGYWMPETIQAADALAPSQPLNNQRYDWRGLSFVYALHTSTSSGLGTR